MQLEWNLTLQKFLLTVMKHKEMTYQIFTEASGTTMVLSWTINSSGRVYPQNPKEEVDYQETKKANSLNT